MDIKVRMTAAMHQRVLQDLRRHHEHATERVGFFFFQKKALPNTTIVIINKYISVSDEDYEEDETVGARINGKAIKSAMQEIINSQCGCLHVHLHDIPGKPQFGITDMQELPHVVQSFVNADPSQIHGLFLLSEDSVHVCLRIPGEDIFMEPNLVEIVGYPTKLFWGSENIHVERNKIYDRQSFLGKTSQSNFEKLTVGVVGLGGGGSHIIQQLAHLGIKNFRIFDEDHLEDTNLNRLIGGKFEDIALLRNKTDIAKRLILGVAPDAVIEDKGTWQNSSEILQECDFVFSAVDSYIGRRDIEAECRRYLIPLIDIGMDIYEIENSSYYSSGQIILSLPGGPCMHCLKFLSDEKLQQEAQKYGNIGGRPQVVWSNGVLASTAVGLFVDIVTGWTKQHLSTAYLEYDGNLMTISKSIKIDFASSQCPHYNLMAAGPPKYYRL